MVSRASRLLRFSRYQFFNRLENASCMKTCIRARLEKADGQDRSIRFDCGRYSRAVRDRAAGRPSAMFMTCAGAINSCCCAGIVLWCVIGITVVPQFPLAMSPKPHSLRKLLPQNSCSISRSSAKSAATLIFFATFAVNLLLKPKLPRRRFTSMCCLHQNCRLPPGLFIERYLHRGIAGGVGHGLGDHLRLR